MPTHPARRILLLLGMALLLATMPARAGTMSVAWDPVTDSDLVGYRIYYGPSSGNYTQQQDVGLVTQATLSGLTDCATYYVAVKARDAAGNLSTTYSNEILGLPRPTLTLVTPSAAEQGLQVSVVITGANFASGATIQFGNPNITVNSLTVNSCTQITATITVSSTAAAGATTVDVTNPDQVFGTSSGLFTVQAAVAPTVASTSPANAATGVPVTVQPSVTFSEAMKASTITSATVRLLDPTNPVAQASGSPTLSSDGRTATIVPAASLQFNHTYKIQVGGGASGAKDLANNAVASTFTQANGFTTVVDSSAPVITAVAAGSVQATTAQVTWTTNEQADSQVFYRKATDASYQQTPLDAALVTSHSVLLQGLSPSTQYFFHVQSLDAGGNTSSSSPDGTFTTTANSYAYIAIEAEGGTSTSPVRATSGAGAFRGAWIDTPSGTPAGSATSPAGKADLGFHVPVAGTWYVWMRLYGASTSSDTWYESVDGATRQQVSPSATGVWSWAAGRSYALTQGLHNLEVGGGEAQARADRVLITNDPTFVPTAQPDADVTAPATPTGPTAAASDQLVTLSWTNSASSDLTSVVVRYRTDGKYPTSPADGFPVVSRSATPGASDSYAHGGLVNGTTYSYSIFAVDGAGNASNPTQIQAVPTDNVPPAPVGNVRRTDKH